jgi:hypothetical protein
VNSQAVSLSLMVRLEARSFVGLVFALPGELHHVQSLDMPSASKPSPEKFGKTFAALREVLAAYKDRLIVSVDKPGDYQICTPTMKDRTGRPLFVSAVQIKKNYVSYHLLPLYMNPALLKKVSPTLKKRMQGKACFNFTEITSEQVQDISDLTRVGIEHLKNFKLPWDKPKKK